MVFFYCNDNKILLESNNVVDVGECMLLVSFVILIGFLVLLWSVSKFVGGVVVVVNYFGVFFFLIGMLIIGFGIFVLEIIVFIFVVI